MFDSVKRRYCPFRICTGRELDSHGRASCREGRISTIVCHFCEYKISSPCGTCALYRECVCNWKDKDVIL